MCFLFSGQKFAINEEKTVIASIIRNYKIRSADRESEMNFFSEFLLRPQHGINISLESRSKSNITQNGKCIRTDSG